MHDAWMDGWMDGWIHACMHACLHVHIRGLCGFMYLQYIHVYIEIKIHITYDVYACRRYSLVGSRKALAKQAEQ